MVLGTLIKDLHDHSFPPRPSLQCYANASVLSSSTGMYGRRSCLSRNHAYISLVASLAPHQVRMVVNTVYTVTMRIYHLKWSGVAVSCCKVCMDMYTMCIIAMPSEMPLKRSMAIALNEVNAFPSSKKRGGI